MIKYLALLGVLMMVLSGCATYQLHKPVDGTRFLALEDNVREVMIEAQLIAHPSMTREEAEAAARETFIANQSEIMLEYRRANAVASLISRVSAILKGEPLPSAEPLE